jgi:hypothetical protein
MSYQHLHSHYSARNGVQLMDHQFESLHHPSLPYGLHPKTWIVRKKLEIGILEYLIEKTLSRVLSYFIINTSIGVLGVRVRVLT